MKLRGDELKGLSVDLTISNSLFENVVYEEQFITSLNQATHLENVTFRDVRLARIWSTGCGIHPQGCRNLLDCSSAIDTGSDRVLDQGPNACSIKNVCIENVDAAGAGPIVISNQTRWSSSGVNTWYGPIEYVGSSLQQGDDTSGTDVFCYLGVALFDGMGYECLDPPVFQWSSGGSCPQ